MGALSAPVHLATYCKARRQRRHAMWAATFPRTHPYTADRSLLLTTLAAGAGVAGVAGVAALGADSRDQRKHGSGSPVAPRRASSPGGENPRNLRNLRDPPSAVSPIVTGHCAQLPCPSRANSSGDD